MFLILQNTLLRIMLRQTLLGYAVPLEQTVHLAQHQFFPPSSRPLPPAIGDGDPKVTWSKDVKRGRETGSEEDGERKTERYEGKDKRKGDTEEEHQRKALVRTQSVFKKICITYSLANRAQLKTLFFPKWDGTTSAQPFWLRVTAYEHQAQEDGMASSHRWQQGRWWARSNNQ